MRNRLVLLTFFLTLFISTKGQPTAESVVRSFGENMFSWTQTGSLKFHENLIELSNGEKEVRVSDELSSYLFNKYNYQDANELNSYLNCLEKEMSNGITIRFSNFRKVSDDVLTVYDSKGLEFIACDINVSGAINKSFEDLFYIRKCKISKIDKYEEITDKETGKKKVRVDFSDLTEPDGSLGFTYNYGRYFPVGGSFNISPEDIPFMWSIDFGVNLDGDKYIIDKVEMTDIMNYKREKKTLNPSFFLTVTPQFYMKYFAIGCGVGFVFMDGTKETESYTNSPSSSSSSSGSSISLSISSSSGASTSMKNTSMVKPMIRPVVKGFIPLSDELYISVSAGYDYVFGYKDKNGFNVGLGLQYGL